MPFHYSRDVKKVKREMKSFVRGEKKKGTKVNILTGEIRNPTKEQVGEFNKSFTTEKPLRSEKSQRILERIKKMKSRFKK